VGSWVFAQGTDPSAVKPAWQIEKEIVVQKNSPLPQFDLAYVGYDYPTLYGSLADYLSPWASPINFALGIETITGTKSAFISGIELEFLFTVRSNGSRFFMNDLVLFGYSFDLTVLRLNAGVRLGLSLLDVTDGTLGNGTYTAIGGTIGPEVSLYIPIAKDNFLYLRSRYTSSAFVSLGSAADPINSGNRDLQILSIQAGLGFKL
jgi:hypothetical protein